VDEKHVVFSGWQGSSDGSMLANNIYAKTPPRSPTPGHHASLFDLEGGPAALDV